MNSDLEQDVRAALRARAASVTPANLRPASAAPARHRSGLPVARFVAPLVAAACVVLLAIVLVWHGRGSDRSPAGGREAVAALAGQGWQLTSIHRAGGTVVTVSDQLAAIAFLADSTTFEFGWGGSLAEPASRLTRCTYSTDPDGRLVVSAATTKRGGVATDRTVQATDAAVDALTRRGTTISVQSSPRQLVLTANGYVLTFADEVPLATSSAPPPPTVKTQR